MHEIWKKVATFSFLYDDFSCQLSLSNGSLASLSSDGSSSAIAKNFETLYYHSL